jgi:alpha-beta hydrolase superfamily lysophospholipase
MSTDIVAEVVVETIAVDVSAVAPAGARQVVVDVFVPTGRAARPVLWWLQPGGGMSRRYWDLDAPGDYSFARHLARRGFVAVTVDHLGIGDSDRPDDGFALTSEVVADVNAHAHRHVLDALRTGSLVDGLAPVPDPVSVGCGHSMGASLTVYQQARHRSHRALALFGYGGRGMPSHLDPSLRRYTGDPFALRRDLVSIARERYPDPLPLQRRGSSPLLVGAPMPEAVHEALVAARTNLLALAGLATMVPGNADPEIAAVDVPVLLAHGDRDIGEPLLEVAADFVGCADLTLYRLLDSGHNHNVSPNRELLWRRAVDWLESIL